jgi:hypothetical protein
MTASRKERAMAVREGNVEQVRPNDDGVNAGSESLMTTPLARERIPVRRDFARELADTIDRELGRRRRSEAVIVSDIRQRAEVYEKAFVQARQDVIDAVGRDTVPAERHTRQNETLRRADVEVLPPEMIGKLAALDARHFGKLHDQQRRAEAALAMAETARLSVAYHAALAAKAPAVSAVVRTTMAASEKAVDANATSVRGDRHAAPRDRTASDVSRIPPMTLDPAALERVVSNRARDAEAVATQLGWNGIERIEDQKQQARRDAQVEERRTAAAGAEDSQPKRMPARAQGGNQVASDEVFTASKDEAKPIVPVEVEDRYLRVGTRFYHPRSTHLVAFEDKGNKLQTQSNSEQIAEAMVAIARARGWDEIKVSGSETFRRQVWLDAVAHGMHVKGYIPSAVDKAELAKRIGHLEANQDMSGMRKPASEDRRRAQAFTQKLAADAIMDHPELAGTYAALASMKKKSAADGLNPQQRAVVMARVEANLVNSIERGELPELKLREQVEVRQAHKAVRKVTR